MRAPAFLVPCLLSSVVVLVAACGDDDSLGGGGSSSGGSSSSGGASSSSGTSGASSGGSSSGDVPTYGVAGPGATHAGCTIFPKENAWNRDISAVPLDDALMSSVMPKMNLTRGLHPDWGTVDDGYGFPITVGKAAAPAKLDFDTTWGPKESDKLACPGGAGDFCYPIPLDAKIEGGGDRHVLFLANDGAPGSCMLYELYATKQSGAGFTCSSAALFKLDSNALRTEGWTSADAAGLPILPGLVRKEEVDRGEITHALRFTMSKSRNAYIHPATHAAGEEDDTLPPMGLRLRLKASVDESAFSGPPLVIVKAMKRFGIILADNGSDWFISGEQNADWDMGTLNDQLGTIKGSDFEIVRTGAIVPVAK